MVFKKLIKEMAILFQKKRGKFLNFPLLLADPTGLEPATSGVTGRCSNQLNYESLNADAKLLHFFLINKQLSIFFLVIIQF